MPLPKVQRNVQDQQGNIVPGVLGSVYNQGTGVLASLFSDDAGTVVLSNPMTNDATYGSFKFYVNPGHYDMTFTKPGYTFEPIYDMQVPQDVLTLGTMATQNANGVAITGGNVTGLSSVSVNAGALPFGQTHLNGPVGIQEAPSSATVVSLTYNKSSQFGMVIHTVGSDTGNPTISFANTSGANVGSINATASATAFNTTSDARLKHAIATLTGALDMIRALRPVSFRWQADDSPGQGFLAHEVQALAPEAVTGEPDAVHADGSVRPQGMDFSKLVPYLVSAVQELAARVAHLEAARA
jgi:Chaperone of endosialidase